MTESENEQTVNRTRLRPLIAIDWRYALGEVALIAVGVLIALAASDWQSDRAARGSEKILLDQISASLNQDRRYLEFWCEGIQKKESNFSALIAHLSAGKPYDESLDSLFGSVYGFGAVPPNKAAYESLKSQGMDLVSDYALRQEIAVVYEKTYWLIDNSVTLSRETILDLFRPYYLSNFSGIRFDQNATPRDYDKILADQEYLNLLEYRLQQIQAVHLPMCESAAEDMDSLLDAIAENLGQ